MRKSLFKMMMSLLIVFVATITGASGNVIMAVGTAMDNGGTTTAGGGPADGGDAGANGAGSNTATEDAMGRGDVPDTFHLTALDENVLKINPMSTPLEQITRSSSGSKEIASMKTRYYSIGTRPISTTLKAAVIAQTSGDRTTISPEDTDMFTKDDTIRVLGVKGVYAENGEKYSDGDIIPDLELKVIGIDQNTGALSVYAVNGNLNSNKQSIYLPAIPAGTLLVRMGKACSEYDAQTGMFNNLPSDEEQYCQNFMLQVEQSTLEKMWKNEANWTFSDQEEAAVYDFKLGRELTSLFGVKNAIKHSSKDNQITYFTKGIWWMAGKDIEIGHWEKNATTSEYEFKISEDDLVDFTKEMFIGVASSKKKILFAGSDLVAALSKARPERIRVREQVKIPAWDLTFTSFKSDFGEILIMHHELFDQVGMSDQGFCLEDYYLQKRFFLSFQKNKLDLKSAGIRNSDAVVLQEVSCMVLKNAKAHARISLAAKPSASTGA